MMAHTSKRLAQLAALVMVTGKIWTGRGSMSAWKRYKKSAKSNDVLQCDDAAVYGNFILARNAKYSYTIWPLEIFCKTKIGYYRIGIGGLDAHEPYLRQLVEYLANMKVGTKEHKTRLRQESINTPVKKSDWEKSNPLHTDSINVYGLYQKEALQGAETLRDLRHVLQEKLDYFKLHSQHANDLDRIYAKARTYKDEVLRQWIDNLTQFVGHPEYGKEALRRIDYIETKLLGGKR